MRQELKYVLAVFVVHLLTLVLSAAAVISEEWIVSPQGITLYSLSCVNGSACLVPPSDLLRASGAFRILSWIGQTFFILTILFVRYSKSQIRYLLYVGLSSGIAGGLCLLVAQTDYTAKVRNHFADEEFHFGYSFNLAWAATTVGIIGGFLAAWLLFVIARGRFGLPNKETKRPNTDLQTVSGTTPGSPYTDDFGVLTSRNASIKHSRFRIPSDPPAQTETPTTSETPKLPRQLDQASEVVITRHEEHGIVINYRTKPINSPPTSPISPRRFDHPTASLRGILKNTKPEDVASSSSPPEEDGNGDAISFPPGDFSRIKSQQDLPYLALEAKAKQVPEKSPSTPDNDDLDGIQINIEPIEQRRPLTKPEQGISLHASKKKHRTEKRHKPHNPRVLSKPRHVGRQRPQNAKSRHATTKKYATVTMTDKGLKVKTVEVTQDE